MDHPRPLLLLLPLLLWLLLVQRGSSQGLSESYNKCAVSLGEVCVTPHKKLLLCSSVCNHSELM
jgi:hypothetical protein